MISSAGPPSAGNGQGPLSHVDQPAGRRTLGQLQLIGELRDRFGQHADREAQPIRAPHVAGTVTDDRVMLIFRHAEAPGQIFEPVAPAMARDLALVLDAEVERGDKARPDFPVIFSERDDGLSAGAVTVWFFRLYAALGMSGCSSHSGRRTFITRGARKISEAGGSLRDIQQLAGHASLQTTQRYIEGDAEAKRKVVDLI
jgi:integrase